MSYCNYQRRGLTVGERFWLGKARLDTSFLRLITISDAVTRGGDVMILAHDASTKRVLNYTRIGEVIIGNRPSWQPDNNPAGAIIGNDVVIGAGSVVSRGSHTYRD